MNAIIMEDTHLHKLRLDEINGHDRSHKACLVELFLAHSFINRF